jgi:hypothetical protein
MTERVGGNRALLLDTMDENTLADIFNFYKVDGSYRNVS